MLFPTYEPEYYPEGFVPDPVAIDIRQMDIHSIDIEDLPIDSKNDLSANISLENLTFVPYEATWVFGQTEDRIVLPFLLAFFGICSLITNVVIILSLLQQRRMRTGVNLMFLNIAISDLLLMICCVPSAIINHVFGVGSGILTENWCKIVHYVLFVTVYVGIYTLVIICIFRLCSQIFSTHVNVYLSPCNAILSSFVIWIAFLFSHATLLLEETPIFQEPFICMHAEVVSDQSKMRTLWLTFLTCSFLLPLLTICTLSAIFYHLMNKSDLRHVDPVEDRNKREVTVITMAIMVVRTVCWLPIQVFVMINVFGMADVNNMYRRAEMLGVCFAFLGTCINLFIFNCLSIEFRQAFGDLSFCNNKRPIEEIVEPCTANMKDHCGGVNETILSILTDSSNHINYST